MAQAVKALEKTIQEEIEAYQQLQKGKTHKNVFQKCVAACTQLDSQLNENKVVKTELDVLEEDATVYKLIGPVLVKQDLSEAKQTVEKRLDYISKEMERYEGAIKDLEKKQEAAREKLTRMQQEYRQAAIKAGLVH